MSDSVTHSVEPVMAGRDDECGPCCRTIATVRRAEVDCDDCETPLCYSHAVRVESPGSADYYLCESCGEKRGEVQDGALWRDAEYPFAENY